MSLPSWVLGFRRTKNESSSPFPFATPTKKTPVALFVPLAPIAATTTTPTPVRSRPAEDPRWKIAQRHEPLALPYRPLSANASRSLLEPRFREQPKTSCTTPPLAGHPHHHPPLVAVAPARIGRRERADGPISAASSAETHHFYLYRMSLRHGHSTSVAKSSAETRLTKSPSPNSFRARGIDVTARARGRPRSASRSVVRDSARAREAEGGTERAQYA